MTRHLSLTILLMVVAAAAASALSLAFSGPVSGGIPAPTARKADYTMPAALAAAFADLQPTPDRLARGREVALGVRAPKGVACTNCHRIETDDAVSGFAPSLQGQPAWYLYKQLHDYASASRRNGFMGQIARGLPDEDLRAVVLYYASLGRKNVDPGGAPSEPQSPQAAAGAALAQVGNNDRGLQACAVCHGTAGEGAEPSVPRLTGQSAEYLKAQLNAWKTDARRNDTAGLMRSVVQRLSAEDIEAVALFYSSVDPAAAQTPISFDALSADAQRGGLLAMQRCATCHAPDGSGSSAVFPRLDGQVPDYLYRQLILYRNGTRWHDVMSPMLFGLTDPDLRDLAAHFGRSTAPSRLTASLDPSLVAAGQELFKNGSPGAGTVACAACHGALGEGLAPSYPRIAGQNAIYTAQRLTQIRDQAAGTDPGISVMKAALGSIDDASLNALAAYVSTLPQRTTP